MNDHKSAALSGSFGFPALTNESGKDLRPVSVCDPARSSIDFLILVPAAWLWGMSFNSGSAWLSLLVLNANLLKWKSGCGRKRKTRVWRGMCVGLFHVCVRVCVSVWESRLFRGPEWHLSASWLTRPSALQFPSLSLRDDALIFIARLSGQGRSKTPTSVYPYACVPNACLCVSKRWLHAFQSAWVHVCVLARMWD